VGKKEKVNERTKEKGRKKKKRRSSKSSLSIP
jgi:hypothetical protein